MREEKTAEELYAGFNEGYEDFPLTFEWKKALEFAREKHKGQLRDEGTPYFEHLKGVMRILVAESNVTDDTILCIAALHDTLEDTDSTYEELEEKFGDEVAGCVQLLTRQPNQSFEDYSRKIFTNEEYPYAREIKLADRLHNLRSLPATGNTEKIVRKIKETEKCILPYENCSPRVLMRKIKEELADLKKQEGIKDFFKKTDDEREP